MSRRVSTVRVETCTDAYESPDTKLVVTASSPSVDGLSRLGIPVRGSGTAGTCAV